jgi:hypothetical protein
MKSIYTDGCRIPPISAEELEASMRRMGEWCNLHSASLKKLRNPYHMSNTEYSVAVKNALHALHIHDKCEPNELFQHLANVHGITIANIRHVLNCVYIAGLLQGKADPSYKLPANPIC